MTSSSPERSELVSVSIHGVAFDSLDEGGVIRRIVSEHLAGRGGWVVTPNVDILRMVAKDEEYARLVSEASLVLVDGAPVEWAGWIAGGPRIQRVPGSSLVWPLSQALAENGVDLLLLGGRPGAGELAAQNLREASPNLDVSSYCPPVGFEKDSEEWQRMVDAVAASSAGVVYCGLGAPKQERVAYRLADRFPEVWFLGIGGSIDFAAGYTRRAPVFMQRVGLEWLHRLISEPRRLFRRYVLEDLPFSVSLFSWALKERRAKGRGAGT